MIIKKIHHYGRYPFSAETNIELLRIKLPECFVSNRNILENENEAKLIFEDIKYKSFIESINYYELYSNNNILTNSSMINQLSRIKNKVKICDKYILNQFVNITCCNIIKDKNKIKFTGFKSKLKKAINNLSTNIDDFFSTITNYYNETDEYDRIYDGTTNNTTYALKNKKSTHYNTVSKYLSDISTIMILMEKDFNIIKSKIQQYNVLKMEDIFAELCKYFHNAHDKENFKKNKNILFNNYIYPYLNEVNNYGKFNKYIFFNFQLFSKYNKKTNKIEATHLDHLYLAIIHYLEWMNKQTLAGEIKKDIKLIIQCIFNFDSAIALSDNIKVIKLNKFIPKNSYFLENSAFIEIL